MGKQTVQQIAGLDVIDWLYFNQTLVNSVMGSDVVAWFTEIVERVKTAVAATGATGMDAERMKHYVLCFLEISASYAHPDMEAEMVKMSQFNKDFFCAMLIAVNDSLIEALSIANTLMDYVLSAPMIVRWRLAERCLAAEYGFAAHECFLWLVEMGAIPCAKFRGADVRQHPSHEAVVARIGLLCEFEGMRSHIRNVHIESYYAKTAFDGIIDTLPTQSEKQMVTEARDLWMAKSFGPLSRSLPIGFNVGRQSDKDYVEYFLKCVHSHWTRQRFCLGTSAGWVSNLGASIILICKSIEDPRPIYVEEKEESADTLAKVAKNTMLRFGMTIHTRSIYVRYREFTKTMLPRIEIYYRTILEFVGPPGEPGFFGAENEEFLYKSLVNFPHDTAKLEHWTVEHPHFKEWINTQSRRVWGGES